MTIPAVKESDAGKIRQFQVGFARDLLRLGERGRHAQGYERNDSRCKLQHPRTLGRTAGEPVAHGNSSSMTYENTYAFRPICPRPIFTCPAHLQSQARKRTAAFRTRF